MQIILQGNMFTWSLDKFSFCLAGISYNICFQNLEVGLLLFGPFHLITDSTWREIELLLVEGFHITQLLHTFSFLP